MRNTAAATKKINLDFSQTSYAHQEPDVQCHQPEGRLDFVSDCFVIYSYD